LRVYDALGILNEILGVGYVYDHMTICDADRRAIAPHKFLLGDARVPPVCALPRSDLHAILLGAARKAGVTVRHGLHVTEIDQSRTDQAAVVFSDGSADTFDLMAGFDGIRSGTRAQLFGTMFTPRYSGYGAWRVQVQRQESITGMEFLQSTDGKVGAMPIGQGTMNLFNIRPEPEGVFFPRKTWRGCGASASLASAATLRRSATRSMTNRTSSTARSNRCWCRRNGWSWNRQSARRSRWNSRARNSP
jgi:2-polyprenyl-6-methoxyphenol hydroxylase-like FAD-dependent oxidoreductase